MPRYELGCKKCVQKKVWKKIKKKPCHQLDSNLRRFASGPHYEATDLATELNCALKVFINDEQVQWHRCLLVVHMRFTERIQASFAQHQRT